MTFSTISLPLLLLLGVCASVWAYDPTTHRDLSTAATGQSVLADDSPLPIGKRARLGFRFALDDVVRQGFENSKKQQKSIQALIGDGAAFEDDDLRSMHHFFNPVTGRSLTIDPMDPRLLPLIYPDVGDITPQLVEGFNAVTQTSPDWSLGTQNVAGTSNEFDYKKARDNFFKALTWPAETERRRYIGLTFESIGHLIHHLQDMAQPQHVRNDLHLQQDERDKTCLPGSLNIVCIFYQRFRLPSSYEMWTLGARASLTTTGYPAVYGPPVADGNSTFTLPRQFWQNANKGIAEYTNRNFLSAGTMGVSPPQVRTQVDVLASELCAMMPPCEVQDLDHLVSFWRNDVDDQFRPGTSGTNLYAASASIYDWDFRHFTPNQAPLYTVNRFTFAYDQAYLLPRAVGYSAGLINYFFRGDMEIALPPESVYAVADTLGTCLVGACFRKVKLFLKNVTPSDDMGPGTLTAVVKFHRNKCYQPDLSGEYGGPEFNPDTCHDPAESIAVSTSVAVSSVGRTFGAAPMEFSFPDTSTIPMYAADIVLQVVFRGKLGQEEDAVAVTTKDIAEPNYLAIANITDFVYDDVLTPNQYYLLPHSGVTTSRYIRNLGVSFGGNNTPIVTMPLMSGGQHAQIAFLTDVADLPATIFLNDYLDTGWILQPEEFTLDDATGKFTRSCTVVLSRGVYREYAYIFGQSVSDHSGEVGWHILSERRRPPRTDAAAAGGRLREPEIVHDCSVPTGGKFDFTPMNSKPFTAAGALPWTIGF